MRIEDRMARITQDLRPPTGFPLERGPTQTLEQRMAFHHTPGVSIAVVQDGRVEWAQGFGVAQAGQKRKVTPRTVFQAASISKPITALAVMRLVQAGRLDLDEDIHTYLTSWRVPARHGWQPRLTLRQLLSHTAGLTVHGFPGYQHDEPLPTTLQVLGGEPPANTPKVEVNILPGLQSRYSGGGTTVVQVLLEDVLRQPFVQIMHELVFGPLGLKDSTFAQPLPKPWHARAATAHPWKGVPLRGKFHTYPEMAPAGLWTTPSDLAQICAELLGVLHDRQKPVLLEKATIESMLEPQLKGEKTGGEFVGLGFFCTGQDESFTFGHGGWNEGFVSMLRMFKNRDQGVVVMVNSNAGWELMDREIIPAIAREYDWPAQPTTKPSVALEHLDTFVGHYQTEAGHAFGVSNQDGQLLIQHDTQPPLPLTATSDLEFSTPLNSTVDFARDEHGAVVSLTLKQDGFVVAAKKHG